MLRAALCIIALALPIAGCAERVDEFSSRVRGGDEAYAKSVAEGVLRNVLRAGYGEPTSFVGLGKYTGTNNTTLSAAVPGFTLSKDPLQIAVTGFSGQEDTNAQIETTVLSTRSFAVGMTAPIDLATFKRLIDGGYPRELLFYLFVGRVRITDAAKGTVTVFRNDPSLDVGHAECPRVDYTDYANRSKVNGKAPADYGPLSDISGCEFHRFQYWVEEAMSYGYDVDFPPAVTTSAPAAVRHGGVPGTPAGDGDKAKGAGADSPAGRICFDPGLMSPSTAASLLSTAGNKRFGRTGIAESPICGARTAARRPGPERGLVVGEPLPFSKDGREVSVRLSLELRSPAAVFRYVGRMIVDGSFTQTELFEGSAVTPTDHRLLAIDRDRTSGCYIVVGHYGIPFCIPIDSPNTKAVVAILATLIEFNTNREDLPTNTTTVNITP